MLIRMPNPIYRRMKGDLRRPHPYAPTTDTTLECTDYVAVPDVFYVKDPVVGAHVDHRAIVLAMKRADHNNKGVLHVHAHGGVASQDLAQSTWVHMRSASAPFKTRTRV